MTKIFPHCTISVGLAPLADNTVLFKCNTVPLPFFFLLSSYARRRPSIDGEEGAASCLLFRSAAGANCLLTADGIGGGAAPRRPTLNVHHYDFLLLLAPGSHCHYQELRGTYHLLCV